MTSDCQVLNGIGLLEYLLGFISGPCFVETMSIIIFARDKNLFLIWTNIIKLFSFCQILDKDVMSSYHFHMDKET